MLMMKDNEIFMSKGDDVAFSCPGPEDADKRKVW